MIRCWAQFPLWHSAYDDELRRNGWRGVFARWLLPALEAGCTGVMLWNPHGVWGQQMVIDAALRARAAGHMHRIVGFAAAHDLLADIARARWETLGLRTEVMHYHGQDGVRVVPGLADIYRREPRATREALYAQYVDLCTVHSRAAFERLPVGCEGVLAFDASAALPRVEPEHPRVAYYRGLEARGYRVACEGEPGASEPWHHHRDYVVTSERLADLDGVPGKIEEMGWRDQRHRASTLTGACLALEHSLPPRLAPMTWAAGQVLRGRVPVIAVHDLLRRPGVDVQALLAEAVRSETLLPGSPE